MQIVTGPSLSSSTFMSAPNSPVPISFPIAELILSQKVSYRGIDISGRAARMYDGLLPFLRKSMLCLAGGADIRTRHRCPAAVSAWTRPDS